VEFNIISSDHGEDLLLKLEQIRVDAHCNYVLVAHLGGTVIAEAGALPAPSDPTMFAALAAASFSSMAQLAVIIQEREFYQMIHLGKKSSLLLYPVNRSSIFVFVVHTGSALKHIREKLPIWKNEVAQYLEGMGGTMRIG
jgi:predicted regulator of Ras-like GTPase activity (Roadblock/LC7/MglB family)